MDSAELFLLIARCLAIDDDPQTRQAVENEIVSGKIPWEKFVWMGSSHLVLPALYSAFKRNGLLQIVPQDLVEHLMRIYELSLVRNQRIIGQSKEIIQLLNSHNIKPFFLKGAGYLLMGLYHDQGDRIMTDIDILLPGKDIPQSVSLMKELGYITPENFRDEDYTIHHHLPPMHHSGRVAMLEIHRAPVLNQYQRILSAKDVLDSGTFLNEWKASVPSVAHMQILQFIHDYQSNRGYLSTLGLLRGLYDFYLLLKLNNNETSLLPEDTFQKKYSRYSFAVRSLFSNSPGVKCNENDISGRYLKRQLFLINHPCLDYSFHNLFYRPVYILGLLFRSFYSAYSRRILFKKINKFLRPK